MIAMNKKIERPIIILGTPRSGTTFLGEVLSAHPDFAYAIEPSPIWRRGNESTSDMLRPEHARQQVIAGIHQRFAHLVSTQGKSRLLEKTPQNCLRLPFINEIFPDAIYIHILRDPIESILSIRKMWQTNTHGFKGVRFSQRLKELPMAQIPRYGAQLVRRSIGAVTGKQMVMWGPLLPGLKDMVRELDILEVASIQWRMCIERVLMDSKTMPSSRYREYQLSDLSLDKMNEILNFCDVSDDGSVINKFNELYCAESIHRHSSEISEDERALIMKWIAPTIQWLERRSLD